MKTATLLLCLCLARSSWGTPLFGISFGSGGTTQAPTTAQDPSTTVAPTTTVVPPVPSTTVAPPPSPKPTQSLKDKLIQDIIDAGTHALDDILSRPPNNDKTPQQTQEDDTTSTTEAQTVPTTTPAPTTQSSSLGGGKFGISTSGVILGVTNLANNWLGIINTGAGLANSLVSQGTALATNISKNAVAGSSQMFHMGLEAGEKMTGQAMGIVQSVGQIIPPVKPIINAVGGFTKPVVGGAFSVGHQAVEAATNLGSSIIDKTNKTVQATTGVIGSITGGLGMANTGVSKVTGIVEQLIN